MNTPLTWMETSPDTAYWIIEKDTPTEPSQIRTYLPAGDMPMIHVQFLGTDQVRPINQMKDFLFIEIEAPCATDFFPGNKAMICKVIKQKKLDVKSKRLGMAARVRDNLKGRKEHERVNEGYRFPDKVEGFWRFTREADEDLPWPVIFRPQGFYKTVFIANLHAVESRARRRYLKGNSFSRLTGDANGSMEYEFEGWRWPSGLSHYIEKGVPPSRAFYQFIMGSDLGTLPSYGRA